MEKDRVALVLTMDAINALARVTTERKRGLWVSQAILAYAGQDAPGSEAGILERIEDKIDRLLTGKCNTTK
jgi:hypothetical protein